MKEYSNTNDPRHLEKLAEEVAQNQRAEKKLPWSIDQRTPEQRMEDRVILERLAREVFPGVSIEENALRRAVMRWLIEYRDNAYNATGELRQFFLGENSYSAHEAAMELGQIVGLDAMNIIVEKVNVWRAKTGPATQERRAAS